MSATQSRNTVDVSFPSSSKNADVSIKKVTTTTKKVSSEYQWVAIPIPSADFKWESKNRLLQKRTPRYYAVDEVMSALEKAILSGKHADALYWTNEYAGMGIQFVTSLIQRCFDIASNSISISNPNLIVHIWNVL